MRFRLDCVNAAIFPAVIVTIASASNSSRQSVFIDGSPSRKIRSSIANDAAFDPTDRNAVTGVGAPSYTSGAHMWNGTAAILNPMPAATDRPYMNDIPYRRMPSENAPSRKYLTAASFDRWLGLMNPARM